jgi:alpha-1,6-mannosyltransferase
MVSALKVVDVNEFYAELGGGVRTYVHQKLSAAAALGVEMVVVAPGPRDGEEERLGGRILWVGGPPMPFDPRYTVLWRERRVHALLNRERPDVVEGSSPWTGGWFAARWKGRSAAKVLVFHSDPVAALAHTAFDRWLAPERIDRLFGGYWRYVRALSRRFDVTVVAGQWLADRLARQGVHRPVAVPFGVERADVREARPDPAVRRALLARCGLGEEAALLVGAGRLNPEKRWGTVMRAAARVARERPAGLVLFGAGPSRLRLERLAAELGHIHLPGRVSHEELAGALAAADAYLHGCPAETFGLAVAEALCAGLPVVVPDRGGAAELVDARSGETYRTGDAADCAAATLRVLGRDREALRAATRKAAEAIPEPSDHFEGLFDLYKDMAAGVRGA